MRQKAESKYIHSIIADHINDPTGLEFLHKDSLEMPKALYSVLCVHISKYDYDKKAPRNEAEQFFWLKAV